MITAEDIAQWRGNPVTKKFREILESDRRRVMESWANGAFKGDLLQIMQGKAETIGDVIDAINDIGVLLPEVGEEVSA